MRLAAIALLLTLTLRADTLDDYIRRQMIAGTIPGVAVAVVKDGTVIELKTWGDASVENRTPVTSATRFQIASVTKALTGTALMLLVQEGALSLDDPVSKTIPDAPESWAPITIRHLATHTSGLEEADLPASLTSAEAVKKIAELPLRWKPGERAAYGNSDFIVLANVIERVTRMSFPAFLQRRLFGPLGMTSSMYDFASESGRARITAVVPRRSGVYLWSDGVQKTYTFLYPPYTYSAGGLFSSLDDLTKWIVAIDGGKLLSTESLDRMWTPSFESVGGGPPPDHEVCAERPSTANRQLPTANDFAIGWIVGCYRGQRIVGHSGGPALADVLRFPDLELTIIVLQNQRRLYPYLAQGVADFFLGDIPIAPSKTVEDPDRALTARLRELATELGRGVVNESRFADADLTGIRDYLLAYIQSLGAAKSFDLIAQRGDSRTYRAVHGVKAVRWTFGLTPEGRVRTLDVEAE